MINAYLVYEKLISDSEECPKLLEIFMHEYLAKDYVHHLKSTDTSRCYQFFYTQRPFCQTRFWEE